MMRCVLAAALALGLAIIAVAAGFASAIFL